MEPIGLPKSVLCSLILNTYVGPGLLSIPSNFKESGVYLSLIYLGIFILFSSTLTSMLIEIHYKAKYLLNYSDPRELFKFQMFKPQKRTQLPDHSESQMFEKPIDSFLAFILLLGRVIGYPLCFLFTVIYLILLTESFGIFAKTLAMLVPINVLNTCDIENSNEFYTSCRLLYTIYLVLLTGFTAFFMAKSVLKQLNMQKICLFLRLFIIIIAIISMIHIMLDQSTPSNGEYRQIHGFGDFSFGQSKEIITAFSVTLMVQMQLTSLFQQTGADIQFHNSIKKCEFVVFIICATLGIVLNLALDEIKCDFSMSFTDFSAGEMWHLRSLVTYIIEFLVKLLPVILAFSNTQILASTLFNNYKCLLHANSCWTQPLNFSIIAVLSLLPFTLSFFSINVHQFLKPIGITLIISASIFTPLAYLTAKGLTDIQSNFDIKQNCKVTSILTFSCGIFLTLAFFIA